MPRDRSRDALITGLGLVSAAGAGAQAHRGCLDQPAAPSPVTSFDATQMPAQVAYLAPEVRPQPYLLRRKDLKLMSQDARLAVHAAGLALEDAGLAPMQPQTWPSPAEEVGLFMGVGLEPGQITELSEVVLDCRQGDDLDLRRLGGQSLHLIPPLSSLQTLPNMALAHVSINFGLMGPGESLSPWGGAGLVALGAAQEAIARGECEIALVGAADSDVDLGGLTSHARLEALAPLTAAEAALALSEGALDGLILGEGACFFVVESRAHAEARGARVLGRVAGAGAAMPRAAQMARFSVEGLAEAVGARKARPAQGELWVMGAAGHCGPWRRAEEVALTGLLGAGGWRLRRASDALGSCVAASGLLELGAALANAPAQGAILALAWGYSGEWAAARVELP